MARAKRQSNATRQVRDMLQVALPEICQTALDLANDPKVAPSARAKLISDLFRAAGLYAEDESAGAKEPHEMTAEELAAAIDEIKDAGRAGKYSHADDDNGIFG